MKERLVYNFIENSGIKGAASEAGYSPAAVTEGTLSAQIGSYIQVVTAFVGVLFLVLMIYGGYTWMTARGNEEDVTKAKKIITTAIIGLVVVLAAYAITAFVGSTVVS